MPVSSHTITIRNRLEIRPGNIILVPGCEPTSAFTSPTLAANADCLGAVITLETALEVIPGSTVVWITNGGAPYGSVRRFFVLPDGPPPSPSKCNPPAKCQTDWYKIMRENAEPITQPCNDDSGITSVDEMCDVFSRRTCGGVL